MSLVTVLASAGLSFGLMRLNADPSLLDYFKKDKEPRVGLTYGTGTGGSNPLTLVIAAANGGKLDTKEEYQKCGRCRRHSKIKGVGTVLSPPVLMAEGRQRFGLVVVSGTVIDILANLFLLPLLDGARLKTRPAPFFSKRTNQV